MPHPTLVLALQGIDPAASTPARQPRQGEEGGVGVWLRPTKNPLGEPGGFWAGLGGGLLATELRVELLDAASGVHEALLAGVGGVRVHGDFTADDEMLDAVNELGLLRLHGRTSRELTVRGDIHEDDVVIFRMAFLLHKIGGLLGVSPDAPCSEGASC